MLGVADGEGLVQSWEIIPAGRRLAEVRREAAGRMGLAGERLSCHPRVVVRLDLGRCGPKGQATVATFSCLESSAVAPLYAEMVVCGPGPFPGLEHSSVT